MSGPGFPDDTQHIAIAGRTGSGKTTAALDMLSRRTSIPWLVIDHKLDPSIKKLNLPELSLRPILLPTEGFWHVKPKMSGDDRNDLEDLLARVFKRGKMGVYVDEGHLMGQSDAVRNIMVAGRSKKVPMMWCSQRAHFIDTFIWSQSTFFRVFALQTAADIKRYTENFPQKWFYPEPYHSHYYDGNQGRQFYLGPSGQMGETIKRVDAATLKEYGRI